ncbi:MAG: hypothetical protein ABJL99_19210 [Aliishimia sp.]
MSVLYSFDLQVGGLAFEIHCERSDLVAFVHEQTLGSWTPVGPPRNDVIQIRLITSTVTPDVTNGDTLMFGFGDNAILGHVDPGDPSVMTSQGMRLFCLGAGEVELTIAPGRLNAFIALYRIVSTLLRDRVLRSGGAELHASAVSNGEQIVVFAGEKGAGKTSLCIDFVLSQGWRFVANDHVFLIPSRDTEVLALPETLRIGQGTLRQHQALFQLAQRLGREPGQDDKTRLHVSDIAQHLDAPVVLNGKLGAVVTCGFEGGLPQGGVLTERHMDRAAIENCLTDASSYHTPQWLSWLGLSDPVVCIEHLNIDDVPVFDVRRTKGDTYAPLRLAKSLAVSLQQILA